MAALLASQPLIRRSGCLICVFSVAFREIQMAAYLWAGKMDVQHLTVEHCVLRTSPRVRDVQSTDQSIRTTSVISSLVDKFSKSLLRRLKTSVQEKVSIDLLVCIV
jgi:hypothetical protein